MTENTQQASGCVGDDVTTLHNHSIEWRCFIDAQLEGMVWIPPESGLCTVLAITYRMMVSLAWKRRTEIEREKVEGTW